MNRMVAWSAQLAVMATPLVGWFGGGWSGTTTLVLYWIETVMTCALVYARARLHQRWCPRRGHFRYEAPGTARRGVRGSAFAGGFLMVSLVFCGAHALFLGALVPLVHRTDPAEFESVSWPDVGAGSLSILCSLVIGFAADLPVLPRWSFTQLERVGNQTLSRVLVMQLTVILGFAVVAVSGLSHAVFGVFVVLKTLSTLACSIPQREPRRPPPWLCRVMNRVPGVRPGERFEDSWARDQSDERARRVMNDRRWP